MPEKFSSVPSAGIFEHHLYYLAIFNYIQTRYLRQGHGTRVQHVTSHRHSESKPQCKITVNDCRKKFLMHILLRRAKEEKREEMREGE